MNKSLLVLLTSFVFLLEGNQSFLWCSPPEEVVLVSPIVKQKMKVHDAERGRDLEVSMWYKGALSKEAKKDLIVISHGWSGNPEQLEWLVKELVEQNYFVIGPKHQDFLPESNKPHINHWNRPLDISCTLDQFLASSYGQYVKEENIGMAGFSLGATTSLWLAGGVSSLLDTLYPGKDYGSEKVFGRVGELAKELDHEMMKKTYRDERIKAVFMMAPAWTWIFDQDSLTNVSIPVYSLGGEKDEVVNTDKNMGYLAEHIPGMVSRKIPNVGHFIFLERTKHTDFMDEQLRNEISQEACDFFERTLAK